MAVLLGISLSTVQAQFTAGDLVVLREGTGSSALTSAGTAVFLDEYTTLGSLAYTVPIPSTGAGELVNSGTAASEGQLSLSANGQYLVLAGYEAAAGTTGVAGSTSASTPRGIATVNSAGTYSLAATSSTAYSGNNIRGGTSDGAGNYWGAGAAATGGTVYMGTGTPAQIVSSNSLAIQDFGGNLYFSTAKGTPGIYKFSGTPTSAATPSLLLAGVANPSDFAFNAGMTIAYVANTAGGIARYDFSGSSWSLDYTLDSGTGMNGLAVDFSGVNPIVYATTESGTSLIEITDTGAGSAATILATAAANEAFRGLEFAPQPAPEPSVLALAGLGLTSLFGVRRLKNRQA